MVLNSHEVAVKPFANFSDEIFIFSLNKQLKITLTTNTESQDSWPHTTKSPGSEILDKAEAMQDNYDANRIAQV